MTPEEVRELRYLNAGRTINSLQAQSRVFLEEFAKLNNRLRTLHDRVTAMPVGHANVRQAKAEYAVITKRRASLDAKHVKWQRAFDTVSREIDALRAELEETPEAAQQVAELEELLARLTDGAHSLKFVK